MFILLRNISGQKKFFDGKQKNHFTTVQGLPSNLVDEIREDKSGRLYFNTSEGVCRLEGTQFILIPEKESEDWQLSQDDLWFKAPKYGASVYRYDGNELLRLNPDYAVRFVHEIQKPTEFECSPNCPGHARKF